MGVQVHHANSTVGKSSIVHNEELLEETAEAVVKEETGRKEESGRTEETDRKEDTGRKEESSKKEASSKKEDSKGEKKEDSNTSTHPNPIRCDFCPMPYCALVHKRQLRIVSTSCGRIRVLVSLI